MPLPILNSHADPTAEDLLRYYARAELHWARHLGEETHLDCGTAIANAELEKVFCANQMRDAAVPPGMTPQQAMDEVTAHFKAAGTRCYQWTMNPAAPASQTAPMVGYLLAREYQKEVVDIMRLAHFPTEPLQEVGDLKIIPGRASFRHVRAIAEESARNWNAPKLADAKLLHLDDSHTDALVAIRGGVAAGYMSVLSIGDIGAIQELYIAAAFRRQGIGRTLMSRALEICARSLFKHVLIGVFPDNAAAIALYERCGFKKVGQSVTYQDITQL